ncbi:zinc finger protein 236-like isoform X2 [Penaeus japonicus]|uniref:zinc finger protein 236-like isoform X2 n=1 Tax=Penaeus japonicus TaxID=27405 RepID=UPI001C70C671|nr:zinc finger protein 236-like isoform X2 [Penaeus japonicus]XP_042883221.1 zinc finger protein 236-like isoform X2 [Penaeus japonicus]
MATGVGDRLSWSSHSIVLANSLHRLYAQSSMLDVRLVCDQAHIYAHKVVLAAGSHFFWERLQSLGAGMVELQMSSVNLGTPITPSDLRAVVEYMYCGELLVPHHRLPYVLALVRSLQVFGFQTDLESQFMTPGEIHYATETPNVIEVPTESPHITLEGTVESNGGLADHTTLPLLTVKPQDQNILQDPPKYSEPLKLDTNLGTHVSSTNMSFSELCTAPGAEGDVFAGQISQVKHNIPSVFESSVLEDNSLVFKTRPPECSEVFSKSDGDVYSGAVLNLTSEPDASDEDNRMANAGKDDRGGQRDPRQANTCILEGDTDDAYNTVMLLEALAGEAAGTPSQAVVDVDSIFLTEDAKMAISPRWIRSRKSLRASAESRARLKVKDSIGGVSLQDTSQRQSTVCPSLHASSPGEEANISDAKESWMVVVPESAGGIPLVQQATSINTMHTQLSLPHSSQELSHDHTPTIHVDSTSLTSQATIPPLATVTMASPIISQASCASTIPVLTHSSVSNPGTLLGHSSIPNAASLLTQSSLPFTPYIQPSLLSTTVLNQSDVTQPHQALSTIPMQVLSAQSLDSEVSISYSPNAPYSVTASSVSSQSSLLPMHVQTQGSVATGLPTTQATIISTSPMTSSRTSSAATSHSGVSSTSSHATSSFNPIPLVSHSSVSSAPDLTPSGISQSSISTPLIIQSTIASNILLTQPPISAPVLAGPSVISTPILTQPNPNISPVVIQPAIPAVPPPELSPSTSTIDHASGVPELTFSSSNSTTPSSSSPATSWSNSLELSYTTASMVDSPIVTLSSSSRSNCHITMTSTSSSQENDIPSTSSSTILSTRSSSSTDTSAIATSASSLTTATVTSVTSATIKESSETTNICTSPISITPSSPDQIPDYPAESEEDDSHECSHCPRGFKTLDKLTLHLWEEHEIGTIVKCQLCDFSSPLQRTLVKHASSHITKDNNTCAICSKKFKTRATIKTHLRVHLGEEVMYKCDSCPVMYSQKFNLIKHMASKHQRDADGQPLTEPLTCPYCAFSTLAEYKLKAHIVRRHTVDKPFKCDHCTYATTEKTALAKHLRTHTKERPYICETCGFHALTLSSLWRHRRSHTGEKPYECEQCGQQYADSKRLRDHMYKHNNVKPFMCHKCGYTCRRKDNLQTHLQKMHKLEDQKGAVVSESTAPMSGKTKRAKGSSMARSSSSTVKNASETSGISGTAQMSNLDDVKVKVGPDASKLQVWADHSYEARGDSGSLLVSSTGQIMGCAGGEVDPASGRELGSSHRTYTTTTIPAQTIPRPGCLGMSGATPALQLSYLLPVTAPADPNITLGTSAEGVILVGQTEVSHTAKPFM